MEIYSSTRALSRFSSWPEVLAYAATGAPLYYQAPMDVRAVRIRYEARPRTVRIFPPGSTGRGRQRTADPFSADAKHLDRFRKPAAGGNLRSGGKRRSRGSRRAARR